MSPLGFYFTLLGLQPLALILTPCKLTFHTSWTPGSWPWFSPLLSYYSAPLRLWVPGPGSCPSWAMISSPLGFRTLALLLPLSSESFNPLEPQEPGPHSHPSWAMILPVLGFGPLALFLVLSGYGLSQPRLQSSPAASCQCLETGPWQGSKQSCMGTTGTPAPLIVPTQTTSLTLMKMASNHWMQTFSSGQTSQKKKSTLLLLKEPLPDTDKQAPEQPSPLPLAHEHSTLVQGPSGSSLPPLELISWSPAWLACPLTQALGIYAS